VMSFIPNPLAAISEAARVLCSNANFIFTTWENKNSDRIKDYHAYLQKSGLEIVLYNETPDWKQPQHQVYQKTLELKDVLIKDMGRDGAFRWIIEAKTYLPVLDNLRRILVVAKKN
ncbi:MAG: hypothetical protein ACXAAI_08835, partial [Promethearchaeota archaeon]